MVSGVQSGSLLQSLRAEQAFKNSAKITENINNDFIENDTESVELQSQDTTVSQSIQQENTETKEFKSSLLEYKKDFVTDFKNFINKIGNFDINDEDIDYALRYGKSILVDQKA